LGLLDFIDAIRGSGRVALVHPYLPLVDEQGETAIVYPFPDYVAAQIRYQTARQLPATCSARPHSSDS
jgi:hypothetical protein